MKRDIPESYPISEAQIVSEERVEPASEYNRGGLDLHELLFIFFSHKWKIIISAAIGFIAAACLYFLKDPVYESQAKLLVHYVIETNTIDQLENQVTSSSNRNMTASMNNEVELLTSWDLAKQVAQAVDRTALVPHADGPDNENAASAAVRDGMKVQTRKDSNVIWVSFQHADPDVPVEVLTVLVDKYFDKHLQTHRSARTSKLLDQELKAAEAALLNARRALEARKAAAEIVSLEDSKTELGARMAQISTDLVAARADLAEQLARVGALQDFSDEPAEPEGAKSLSNAPSNSDIEQYREYLNELATLKAQRVGLLSKFTRQNSQVKRVQVLIDAAEEKKSALLAKFPSLNAIAGASTNPLATGTSIDPRLELARLEQIKARIQNLEEQDMAITRDLKALAAVTADITFDERAVAVAEARVRYLETASRKATTDSLIKPSETGLPNITTVQSPSTVAKVAPDWVKKVTLVLAFSGLAFGLGLAFVIEMFLDRSVKRPQEFGSRLHFPLMLSIPYLKQSGGSEFLALPDGELDESRTGSKTERKRRKPPVAPVITPWNAEHFIRPFSDAVRDRLGYHFEIHDMTHKPKLIAVTGFSDGAGTSCLACGLAASIAETGDGKILYVDLNANATSSEGESVSETDDASGDLQSTDDLGLKEQQENLFIARVGSGRSVGNGNGSNGNGRTRKFMPKKLYDLIPQFKSSDFDYVIFDMPPLGPMSPTLAMAGFMDKVLMVVDAGKTNREVIRRGYEELVGSKADVSTILNKTRESLPTWLQG